MIYIFICLSFGAVVAFALSLWTQVYAKNGGFELSMFWIFVGVALGLGAIITGGVLLQQAWVP